MKDMISAFKNNTDTELTVSPESNALGLADGIFSRMSREVISIAIDLANHDDAIASIHMRDAEEYMAMGDEKKAVLALKQAADLGYLPARISLAKNLIKSDEIDEQFSGFKLMRLAAAQGSTEACLQLAWLSEIGRGTPVSQRQAVNWYRKAAEQGNAEAQLNLGVKYDNGEGVQHNEQEACRWYRLAAEQGNADARYFFASALENGEGIAKDIDEAIDWYILAAEKGKQAAKARLWKLANLGVYVPESQNEAIFIEHLGAEFRDPYSLFKCAFRLASGIGVELNCLEALPYYLAAASGGVEDAIDHIQVLSVRYPKYRKSYKQVLRGKSPLNRENNSQSTPSWMKTDGYIGDYSEVQKFRRLAIQAATNDDHVNGALAEAYFYGRGVRENSAAALEFSLRSDRGICRYISGYVYARSKQYDRAKLFLIAGIKSNESLCVLELAQLLYSEVVSIEKSSDLGDFLDALEALAGDDLDAMVYAGLLYEGIEGIPEDSEKAFYWRMQAYRLGGGAYANNLAICFQDGIGTTVDIDLAKSLYLEAIETGCDVACNNMIRLLQWMGVNNDDPEFQYVENSLEIITNENVSDEPPHNETSFSKREQRLAYKRSLEVLGI